MDSIGARLQDAKLGSVVDNAKSKLPDGYTIEVNIELDCVTVTLWGPDGKCDFPTNYRSLASQIKEATKFAIEEAESA